MGSSTFSGPIRDGKDKDNTIGYPILTLSGSFDPTSASQVSLGYLPDGAKVIDVVSYGGATGGTNPTVDIGTSGNDDGFANELDADGVSGAVSAGTTGALINSAVSGITEVFGKVGASAATGGTTSVIVKYVRG